jgi:hypothetical protein
MCVVGSLGWAQKLRVREDKGSAVLAKWNDAESKIKTESLGDCVVRIEMKVTKAKDKSKIQYSARARWRNRIRARENMKSR